MTLDLDKVWAAILAGPDMDDGTVESMELFRNLAVVHFPTALHALLDLPVNVINVAKAKLAVSKMMVETDYAARIIAAQVERGRYADEAERGRMLDSCRAAHREMVAMLERAVAQAEYIAEVFEAREPKLTDPRYQSVRDSRWIVGKLRGEGRDLAKMTVREWVELRPYDVYRN